MARRPSKHLRPARPLSAGHGATEHKSDGSWVVRSIPGAHADKDYLCPGCLTTVRAATPHIVAWPSEPPLGVARAVDARRHWHTGCWQRRR